VILAARRCTVARKRRNTGKSDQHAGSNNKATI
jgi:hypothetical protein